MEKFNFVSLVMALEWGMHLVKLYSFYLILYIFIGEAVIPPLKLLDLFCTFYKKKWGGAKILEYVYQSSPSHQLGW